MTPTTPNWTELIGKRVLLTKPGNITREEAEILEVSQTGEFVRLRWTHGTECWRDRDEYQLLEVLAPKSKTSPPAAPDDSSYSAASEAFADLLGKARPFVEPALFDRIWRAWVALTHAGADYYATLTAAVPAGNAELVQKLRELLRSRLEHDPYDVVADALRQSIEHISSTHEANWSELLGCGDALRVFDGVVVTTDGETMCSALSFCASRYSELTETERAGFRQLAQYLKRRCGS